MRVSSVACGHEHAAIISQSGELMTFGNGRSGCLGHGTNESTLTPRLVEAINQRGVVVGVSCGAEHTAAILRLQEGPGGDIQYNELMTFGSNRAGQLGVGDDVLQVTWVWWGVVCEV